MYSAITTIVHRDTASWISSICIKTTLNSFQNQHITKWIRLLKLRCLWRRWESVVIWLDERRSDWKCQIIPAFWIIFREEQKKRRRFLIKHNKNNASKLWCIYTLLCVDWMQHCLNNKCMWHLKFSTQETMFATNMLLLPEV